MLADLDLPLTAVFATADDLLPGRPKNARRSCDRPTDKTIAETAAAAEAFMATLSEEQLEALQNAYDDER
jgi:hypothetical protein